MTEILMFAGLALAAVALVIVVALTAAMLLEVLAVWRKDDLDDFGLEDEDL
jgi:hypothetical protein